MRILPRLLSGLLASATLLFTPPLASRTAATVSVIDYISASSSYSALIRALQRTRLIPLLNRLDNCTFFAPTNAAFEKLANVHGVAEEAVTREMLLYHVLRDRRALDELKASGDGSVHQTVLVWGSRLGENVGQRLKMAVGADDGAVLIGERVPVASADGIAHNGIVHGVDDFIQLPDTLEAVIARYPELSMVVDALKASGLFERFGRPTPTTLFSPINAEAWGFSDVEYAYLRHERGGADLGLLTGHHVHTGQPVYVDEMLRSQDRELQVPVRKGGNVTLHVDAETLQVAVGQSSVKVRDLIASNGVLHIVEDVVVPKSLAFNPYKLAIGLDGADIAAAWTRHGLDTRVNSTSEQLTLFIPPDAAGTASQDGSWLTESTARYHMVAGRLREDADGYQVAKSDLANARTGDVRLPIRIQSKAGGIESVNGIALRHAPVTIGNVTLYALTSSLGEPQSLVDFVQDTGGPGRRFAAAMNAAGLGSTLRDLSGVTYFVPTAEAYERSGLVADYLMLPDAVEKLRIAVQQAATSDGAILSEEIANGPRRITTIGGDTLLLYRDDMTGALHVNNTAGTSGVITESDFAVDNGVVHFVDQVIVPPRVHISVRDLLRGAGATTFIFALDSVGLSGLVDAPAEQDNGYTFLAPTDAAFAAFNDTMLFGDTVSLRRVILGHVLRGKKLFGDQSGIVGEHGTLLGEQMVIFKQDAATGEREVVVEGSHARIESQGIVAAGIVYKLDRVLSPGKDGWGWLGPSLLSLGSLGGLGAGGWYSLQRYKRYRGYQAVSTAEAV